MADLSENTHFCIAEHFIVHDAVTQDHFALWIAIIKTGTGCLVLGHAFRKPNRNGDGWNRIRYDRIRKTAYDIFPSLRLIMEELEKSVRYCSGKFY